MNAAPVTIIYTGAGRYYPPVESSGIYYVQKSADPDAGCISFDKCPKINQQLLRGLYYVQKIEGM